MRHFILSNVLKSAIVALVLAGASTIGAAPVGAQAASDTTLNPEVEVDSLIAKMTLEQKVGQISNDTRPAEVSTNRPVAAMGSRLGVDLWHYHTPDGRGLRRGVDYLVAFATGERHFPYRQIGGFRPSALHPVLLWAALGWNDASYRKIAQQIGGGSARLELTFP